MSIKIYYFTGTGNSLYLSKKLSSILDNCDIDPIAKYYKKKEIQIKEEIIGFITPLYSSGLPQIVYEFIKKANLEKVKYIFGIVNGGIPITSSALSLMNKLLKEKNKKLNAGFIIKMIDNYILNFKMPAAKEQKKFEDKFEKKINKIKKIIEEKLDKKRFEFKLLSNLINIPWLKKVNLLDKNFYFTDSCSSCRTCEKVCPVNNISMENNKPKWNNNCQLCLACLQFCPKNSIQYSGRTEKRKNRYHNRNVSLKEIIAQKIN